MNPWIAFVLGLGIFGLATAGKMVLWDALSEVPVWIVQVGFQFMVVLLGYVVFARKKISLSACGFRWVSPWSYGFIGMAAFSLGALTTATIILTPAKGLNLLEQYSLLEYVVLIWFFSSVLEEVFVRGWLQSAINNSKKTSCCGWPISTAVLSSASLFGAMHLATLLRGADVWTAMILVAATLMLGFVCAHVRERSGSLVPAILAHGLFNVGAFFGGIVVTLVGKALAA